VGEPDEIVGYVRFDVDDQQLLHPVEVRVTERWLPRLRDLPLSRIENAVNADPRIRLELTDGLAKPMNADPARFFATKKQVRGAELPPRHQLKRPAKRRLDDDFYVSVARAYADAVAWGLDPRKTLALDSETPADTVARWIRKARKKGYLTAAEPGKASGALSEKGGHDG
jgi:hypothetical protein